MTRLLFSGVVVLMLAACTFDVNVHGIPKSIAVDIPQLRQPALPPMEPDPESEQLPQLEPDDAGDEGGDQ